MFLGSTAVHEAVARRQVLVVGVQGVDQIAHSHALQGAQCEDGRLPSTAAA